jgi:hypothetical protein
VRVLFLGNIANNGYLNARLLNEAGADCDVVCADYYHIMGCPEWEDADFVGDVGDDFFPRWRAVDLRGFRRPPWFAQGPLAFCVAQLRQRHGERLPLWWRLVAPHIGSRRLKVATEVHRRVLREVFRRTGRQAHTPDTRRVMETFAEAFPDRPDALQLADIAGYTPPLRAWRALFPKYDVVIASAVEPIWPFLAGQRPYIAYEHGTIRGIPFEATPQGRLTAIAYHQADGVVITNCDNQRAAERLGLRDYRFVPHPINERWTDVGLGAASRKQLLEELDADFLIFHPSRHHWDAARHPSWEKGNDVLIHGLASFFRDVAPRAAAVFVEWGQKVRESKVLLEHLGIARRVKWIRPQHGRNVSRYMSACDLVADQFFLGAFGAITPRALAMSRPAMLHLDEAIHRWAFSEIPPVINARTPEEVHRGLAAAYANPNWLCDLGERGQQWYRRYHSNAVVRKRLVSYCEDVLARPRRAP